MSSTAEHVQPRPTDCDVPLCAIFTCHGTSKEVGSILASSSQGLTIAKICFFGFPRTQAIKARNSRVGDWPETATSFKACLSSLNVCEMRLSIGKFQSVYPDVVT